MQGKDPFLALLGLFILATTFFFCGKGVVTSPPPVALENRTTIPPTAPNIGEPLPLSPAAPSGSAPMGFHGKRDAQSIGQTIIYRMNNALLLPEEDTRLNRVPARGHGVSTVVLNVGGHRDNRGVEHQYEVLSEQRAQADTEDAPLQRIAVDQLTPNWYRMSQPVAAYPTEEWRWQERRLESFIGTEGEQP